MTTTQEIRVPEWKLAEVEELAGLITRHEILAVANLHKVRATQIQELRKRFRGEVTFKAAKKNLLLRALEKVKDQKPNINALAEHIEGSNVYVFTDRDPFKLSILFDKGKVRITAKAGDIASDDVTVPAGNTGIPPGPIISEFSEIGIPTRIESGSVWISSDSVVAKKGEEISPKLASILSKLGIKPVEAGMGLTAAYQNGLIYMQDILKVDLQATKSDLQTATTTALNLAFNANFPSEEVLPLLLSKAAVDARSLAINAKILEKETIPDVLWKSFSEATTLQLKLDEKEHPQS